MNRTTRALTAIGFGLSFTVLGTGVGNAAMAPDSPSGSARITQCNADPAYDATNDPVHCHYAHKLPSAKDGRGHPRAN